MKKKTLTPTTVLILKSCLDELIKENLDLKARVLAQAVELDTLILTGGLQGEEDRLTGTKTSPN
jgi:hypothetical protein